MAQVIAFPRPFPQSTTPVCPQAHGLALYIQRIQYRRMLARDLLHAPDSALQDAGLTRADVLRETAKPFWRA
ncbi:hypothetical protein KMP13_17045 [Epibacterium ulvae]|uniref:DUF1127 domain-containing protein n=1 Tax=Epibacterium ulvae TaxID=1156985 RepID=UPI001BFC51BF|nr:hypothetical protein [Epibacterium ulvae]MBT8155541.1 hypothetical protein [Epibacterium ulvae]